MARYKLHCFCQSGNSYKVALYLNCAGLDWEPVFVDFFKDATRDPKWRASVNEMGEAPVLEIEDKKLSQSGAILLHLAQTTGKFAAQNEAERNEVLRWILFDNHKFTSYLATYRYLKAFLPQAPDPNVLAFMPKHTVSLDDKYSLDENRQLLTGTQAIVRLMLVQRARDLRAGVNTAGYVTGYRGSPIASLEAAMIALSGPHGPDSASGENACHPRADGRRLGV